MNKIPKSLKCDAFKMVSERVENSIVNLFDDKMLNDYFDQIIKKSYKSEKYKNIIISKGD